LIKPIGEGHFQNVGFRLKFKEIKKPNKNLWPKPSGGRQKRRPKIGQKTCSPHEPKKGES
jgi:hypothetical protein